MIRTSILAAALTSVACLAQAQDRSQARTVSDINRDRAVTKSEFFTAVGPELAGTREILFRKRDRNGDGVISDADANHRSTALKPPGRVAKRTSLRTADRNGDGMVSLEEFTRALPDELKPLASVMFPKHDSDGDGRVTEPEL